MDQHLVVLAVASGLAVALQRYAPQYSPGLISSTAGLFAVMSALYILYRILLYPRFFSPLRHLPTAPDAHWFWGQTTRVVREPTGQPMIDWAENVPNNGLIRYSLWFQERVLVTNPAALSEVLVTKNYDFVKPAQLRNGLGRILGIGILLAEGDEHKRQRKNLMPAFAFRHVKNLYPVFWAKARELVDCLAVAASDTGAAAASTPPAQTAASEQHHEPGAIDVGSWSSRATLDIIGVSGMGQDFHALQDPSGKLNQTYRSVFTQTRSGRLLQLAGVWIPFWLLRRLPIQRNHDINAAMAYIKQVCRDLIAKKRVALASEKGNTEIDILSVALESGGFRDEELVNQMMTFLVAGHETTATAMTWALYLLCQHPSIQTKLRLAIRADLPSPSSPITASTIDSCSYLHAVCNEVLRLWAPVALTLRVAATDTSILGAYIPRGTTVVLCPWATNTSPQLWGPDAKEFRPERWLSNDDHDNHDKANAHGGAASNYAFLTFLHGPRSCIGQKFATAEFACLLAAWVGRFETTWEQGSRLADGELEIIGGVTAKPKGGLWCNLKQVEGW